jgi:hypothetical protein
MIPSSRNCWTNVAGIGARRINRENFRSRSTPTGEVYLTGEGDSLGMAENRFFPSSNASTRALSIFPLWFSSITNAAFPVSTV